MIPRVVSYCPVCAAPIYGPRSVAGITPGYAYTAPVAFSCECRFRLLSGLDALVELVRAQAALTLAGVPKSMRPPEGSPDA